MRKTDGPEKGFLIFLLFIFIFSFPFPFSLYLSFSPLRVELLLFLSCSVVLLLVFGWCCVSLLLLRGAAWYPPSLALFSSPFAWCRLVSSLFGSPVWWGCPSFTSFGRGCFIPCLLLGGAAWSLPPFCVVLLLFPSPVQWCSLPSRPLGGAAFRSSFSWEKTGENAAPPKGGGRQRHQEEKEKQQHHQKRKEETTHTPKFTSSKI